MRRVAALTASLLALPSIVTAQTTGAATLTAPRSGWCSLSATPTLRWRGATGTHHVAICRDRACAAVFEEADVSAQAWTPTRPLTRGVWFWRVRSGERSSPVWSFTVTARPGSADLAIPRCADVDGDGFGDALLQQASSAHRVSLRWGSRAGFVRRRPQVLVEPPSARVGSGGEVELAGDLDGDGYADLLWSNPFAPSRSRVARDPASAVSSHAGVALVYRGGPRGITSAPAVRLDAREGEFLFGRSLTAAGDVDGDGRGDLLVLSDPSTSEGERSGPQLRRRLFDRGGPVVDDLASLRCSGGDVVFAAAGDVDGDGFADVIGACTSGSPPSTRVRVLHGSVDGLARVEDLDVGPARSLGGATVRVSSLGDVDGDGFADVIAAWENADHERSVALVWRGASSAMGGAEEISFVRSEEMSSTPMFAHTAGTVGDLDHDGRDDVMLSVTDTTQALYRSGRFDAPVLFTRGDGFPVSFFGWHRACGDVDGDGHADVLLGASCAETDTNSGDSCLRREYYLLRGGADGVSPARMEPVSE